MDLYEKELWRKEWEKEIQENFLTEMMDAARSDLSSRWESEKLEWEAQTIEKFDEQIEAMKQWFQPQIDMAHEAAQKANAHAETQIELYNRIWANLRAKQEEVNLLQTRLNEANTSSTEGLAKYELDNATAILIQKNLEIEKLLAESTKAKSELDISNKARHNAVEEAANHAKEIENLEERLEVVRGVNKDLYSAGVEKTRKIYQLEAVIEEAQSLSQASQNLAKEPNEPDGESQALPRDPNATNESNVDEQALKGTMTESRENEYLVDALKHKLAILTNESDAELKKLKLEMAAGLEEVMEEKGKVVEKLKMVEDSEKRMNRENQTLKRCHSEMAREASKDAADIASLFDQVKLFRSAGRLLLLRNGNLQIHVKHFKSKLLVETKLVDDANSQITKLNEKIFDQEFRLSNTAAQNSEIKALKKAVREAESTIFRLRQWDAESGVTERDELIKKRGQTIKKRDMKIQQLEKSEKRCIDHIRKLEKEIFKRNIGLIEKVSRWTFGKPLPWKGYQPRKSEPTESKKSSQKPSPYRSKSHSLHGLVQKKIPVVTLHT